ncbi:MAG TPA: alpha/beta fold hydrolase [Anaerolineales bacterium]|nr:alpha/beta fold hydrolase [Anaerolineales bacterium]
MPKPSFPIEEIARYPAPGNVAPGAFAFRPHGSLLTYLYSPEHSLSRQIYALDIKTGERRLFLESRAGVTEENISRPEALRRERQRQLATGITQYEWAPKGDRVLIPLPDGLYIQEGLGAPLRRILDVRDRPALDARFSPDGKWISYVQSDELYVVPAEGGVPRQVTHGAKDDSVSHGLAEYVAQEEMDRSRGYWWSPDSKSIAFEEVDESRIPPYRIVRQGRDISGEDHHYPFAGQPNAAVRLGVVSVQGGEPVWMQPEAFEYLARVKWMPDGSLTAQLENREQTRLDLVRFDIGTGEGRVLLTERSDTWINLHDMFRPLPVKRRRYPGGFIWASEVSGFMHLYLYDAAGNLVRALTRGEWVVNSIAGVDSKHDVVYFTGRMDSALETHLYAVSFDGETPRRITREPGMHSVTIDPALKYFVDVHDSPTQPPHVTLRRLKTGSRVRKVYDNDDPRVKELRLRPPQFVQMRNREGVLLHAALYEPHTASKKLRAAVIYVYGGPHAQMVTHSWNLTASLRAQYLRGLGYVVFVLDNRGSANRGLAFESAIQHDMGNCEVEDQVDGVRWLVERDIADPSRVGVYGWSYGGYMALMCLCRAPDVFRMAVAGAPVTHWDGYDTHYTERYMGAPAENRDGYRESSVMSHVGSMNGKLLLVHGLVDENVHFRHTARLVNALIQARKHYELLLFPDERHSPRKLEDRIYMEEQIRDFVVRNL